MIVKTITMKIESDAVDHTDRDETIDGNPFIINAMQIAFGTENVDVVEQEPESLVVVIHIND